MPKAKQQKQIQATIQAKTIQATIQIQANIMSRALESLVTLVLRSQDFNRETIQHSYAYKVLQGKSQFYAFSFSYYLLSENISDTQMYRMKSTNSK